VNERPKMLIVDDRKENNDMMKLMLEDLDIDVLAAASGPEALSLVPDNDFFLAVIDIQMPEMDGFQLLDNLRKIEKTRDLPVIFLSGVYTDQLTKVRGIESGAIDFLTKNINPDIITGKVRAFLELYKRQESLRKSEDILRDFFQGAPVGFHIFDRHGIIIDINKAELDMIGYERHEVVGKKKWIELILPEERGQFQEHWKHLNEKGEVKNLEYTMVHRDGRHVNVILNASSRFDNDGNLVNSRGSVLNITESIMARQKILSMANYPEENPNPVLRINEKGKILYSNRSGEKLIKIWEYDLKDKLPDDIFELSTRCLKTGKPEEIELSSNGSFLLLVFSPVADSGYVNIYGTDITRLKEIESELIEYRDELEHKVQKRTRDLTVANKKLKEEINERIRTEQELIKMSQALEQSLNVVMITDVSNTVEYVNPKFLEITGYSRGEIINKKASVLGTHTEEETREFWNVLNKNGEWQGELYSRKKNGELFWEYASIAAVKDDRGNVIYYIKDSVDITKRKASERELEDARNNAEMANRAKSEFLANMSHEIRTPMNSILGFIQMLDRTELDRKQAKFVSYIDNSSRNLLQIINDILDFSKLESEKFTIDNYSFSPRKEFEIEVEIFQAIANEKSIDLITFIDPTLQELVSGDSLRIRQVLNNLISNALKFTSEKNYILVNVENIGVDNNISRIYFSVSDTGIGISKEMQEKIFSPFQQEDASTTRRFGGTGLGLSISSDLVELMGSRIEFVSYEGEGSRFFFDIELTIVESKNEDSVNRFGDVNIALYITDQEYSVQDDIIMRYLDFLSPGIKIINGSKEIKISDENDVIFISYTPELNDRLIELSKEFKQSAFIFAATINTAKMIPDLGIKQTVIKHPVTYNKIVEALNEVMFEDSTGIKVSREIVQDRVRINASVLAAEDNRINQELISIILNEEGMTVDIAENGLEAVEKFRSGNYDIILMDVNMPVMDGVDAMKKIREIENSEGLKHTPIVALTAKAVLGERESLLEEGLDDYLSKPIDIKEINEVLLKYLGHLKVSGIYFENEPVNSNESIHTEEEYNVESVAKSLGVKPEVVKVIIKEFISGTDEHIQHLKRSIKDNDYDGIYEAAHKLWGAALNLRFNRIASLLEEMEGSVRGSDSADYIKILGEIENELGQISKKSRNRLNYY